MTTATSGVLASLRFPWLLPVRNSFASYGASMCNGYKKRGLKGYPYRESAHPSSQKKPIVRKTCSKETHPGLQISFSFEQADPPVEARLDLAAHFALWSHQPLCPHMPSHLFPHHALLLRFVSLQRSTLISAAP